MVNKTQLCCWCGVFLFLAACSSHREKTVEEIFVTEIREDSSKMFAFTLTQEKAARSRQADTKTRAGKQGKSRKGGKEKGAGKNESRERQNPLEDIFQQRLEQRLSQNNYCRTGYLELERYASRGAMTMRGECNESATESDRQRFPNQTGGGI
ncbi:hypothetical protein SG34_026375 [Thalassomonas viridans]|uniref:Lipoprotein n=1 Tax=Thalassomonas viridans TaxID=137584 RepID=A0AAF0C8I8_9GAMM|nr:hypothetical protein [Thalassomonas viridans]WDE04798.1 hypothetical protein SG34_026375 [Thalassomonas viridans]